MMLHIMQNWFMYSFVGEKIPNHYINSPQYTQYKLIILQHIKQYICIKVTN